MGFLIGGVVLVVIRLSGGTITGLGGRAEYPGPSILQHQYAAVELSREEYEQMCHVVER